MKRKRNDSLFRMCLNATILILFLFCSIRYCLAAMKRGFEPIRTLVLQPIENILLYSEDESCVGPFTVAEMRLLCAIHRFITTNRILFIFFLLEAHLNSFHDNNNQKTVCTF